MVLVRIADPKHFSGHLLRKRSYNMQLYTVPETTSAKAPKRVSDCFPTAHFYEGLTVTFNNGVYVTKPYTSCLESCHKPLNIWSSVQKAINLFLGLLHRWGSSQNTHHNLYCIWWQHKTVWTTPFTWCEALCNIFFQTPNLIRSTTQIPSSLVQARLHVGCGEESCIWESWDGQHFRWFCLTMCSLFTTHVARLPFICTQAQGLMSHEYCNNGVGASWNMSLFILMVCTLFFAATPNVTLPAWCRVQYSIVQHAMTSKCHKLRFNHANAICWFQGKMKIYSWLGECLSTWNPKSCGSPPMQILFDGSLR